ncbi:MAG: prepilin peptidase [Proteobacteria bacterium]|nr:prepilin peptidase [Pseudomonadota bacterium]
MLHTLSIALLPTLMIVAAVSDVARMKIPNWLTALVAVAFFPMALLIGMPMSEFVWHVAGGLILFVAGFVLFSVGLFGGGDAKLLAAAGLWFGTAQTMPFLIATVTFGGIMCLAFVIWSFLVFTFDMHGPGSGERSWLKQMMRVNVPYGLAIAAGAILAFPATPWVKIG